MPIKIPSPTRVEAVGNKPKLIDEFVGRVNTQSEDVSIAHMRSPGGWVEPGQRPEFREHTIVIRGMLRVEYEGGVHDIRPGEAISCEPGEWIRYSTPEAEGAEYLAVCMPAFSPTTVHRDPLHTTPYTSLSWEERRAELEARPLLDELPSPSTTNGLGWDETVSSDRIDWEWDHVEFANIDLKTGEVIRGTAHPNPHCGGGAIAYDTHAFMEEGFKRWYRQIPAEILEHLFDVVRLLLHRA